MDGAPVTVVAGASCVYSPKPPPGPPPRGGRAIAPGLMALWEHGSRRWVAFGLPVGPGCGEACADRLADTLFIYTGVIPLTYLGQFTVLLIVFLLL